MDVGCASRVMTWEDGVEVDSAMIGSGLPATKKAVSFPAVLAIGTGLDTRLILLSQSLEVSYDLHAKHQPSNSEQACTSLRQ